jgi:hypothetical protein
MERLFVWYWKAAGQPSRRSYKISSFQPRLFSTTPRRTESPGALHGIMVLDVSRVLAVST